VNDRTHGQQFKARFLRTSPPTSADGIGPFCTLLVAEAIPFSVRNLPRHLFSEARLIEIERELGATEPAPREPVRIPEKVP
jgi:hypothetical protein